MCGIMEGMMALSLAGTAVSAAGQVASGKSAEAMGKLQQQAYEQQAENERRAAGFAAGQELRKGQLTAANARAQIGASGLTFEGSPTEVLAHNAAQNQLDIEAIKYGSDLKQGQLRTQGQIALAGGEMTKNASNIGAAGTAISGIGRSVSLGKSPFA